MFVPVIAPHVAIIMDGNGRWAKQRHLPRAEGHRRGVQALNRITEAAVRAGVKELTVFAFSSENWARPQTEVDMLMKLFASALQKWTQPLLDAGVALRVIGDKAAFSSDLNTIITDAEAATRLGSRMRLNVAANYGGRWDLIQAVEQLNQKGLAVTPDSIEAHLTVPAVDLMIRTGGEYRLSNFLLWQSAYAEVYFTERLWPDFNEDDFTEALRWYAGRERRFGRTSEQLQHTGN